MIFREKKLYPIKIWLYLRAYSAFVSSKVTEVTGLQFPVHISSVTQGSAMANPNSMPLHNNQVITDKQMETLRRQICVYSTICNQLVEMHRAMSQQRLSSLSSKLHSYNCYLFMLEIFLRFAYFKMS